jgi:hypothetical protein
MKRRFGATKMRWELIKQQDQDDANGFRLFVWDMKQRLVALVTWKEGLTQEKCLETSPDMVQLQPTSKVVTLVCLFVGGRSIRRLCRWHSFSVRRLRSTGTIKWYVALHLRTSTDLLELCEATVLQGYTILECGVCHYLVQNAHTENHVPIIFVKLCNFVDS